MLTAALSVCLFKVRDRIPLIVCGALNAVLFFTDRSMVDYIPRFTFASLLVFGGLGFGMRRPAS